MSMKAENLLKIRRKLWSKEELSHLSQGLGVVPGILAQRVCTGYPDLAMEMR